MRSSRRDRSSSRRAGARQAARAPDGGSGGRGAAATALRATWKPAADGPFFASKTLAQEQQEQEEHHYGVLLADKVLFRDDPVELQAVQVAGQAALFAALQECKKLNCTEEGKIKASVQAAETAAIATLCNAPALATVGPFVRAFIAKAVVALWWRGLGQGGGQPPNPEKQLQPGCWYLNRAGLSRSLLLLH
jgi:hypothetical protein